MSLEKMECGVNYTTETIRTNINGLIDQSVSGIKSLESLGLYDGMNVSVTGFYSGTTVGGGEFIWDASKDKASHNGGTIIAPEAIAAWDGSQVNLSQLLSWTGTGSGCWVRCGLLTFSPIMFGAIGDKVTNDTAAVAATMDAFTSDSVVDLSGAVYAIYDNIYIYNKSFFKIINGGFFKPSSSAFTDPILSIIECTDLSLSHITVEGSAPEGNETLIAGDYGIRIRSCKRVTLTGSHFSNLHDSALTVSTKAGAFPLGKSECEDIAVVGNIFNNVYQTSTTGNSGGCINYSFTGNICNVVGSIKFASRSDNAKNLVITDNVINSKITGIEIVGYTNVIVSNNIINSVNFGINMYLNESSEASTSPLSDIIIESNDITTTSISAIRVSTQAIGLSEYNYEKLKIQNNALKVTSLSGDHCAIRFAGDGFGSVLINGNTILGGIALANNQLNSTIDRSEGVTISNNTASHSPSNNIGFISSLQGIPNLTISNNRVAASKNGLLSLSISTSKLSDNLVVSNNTVRSEGKCIDCGYGDLHKIQGNILFSTAASGDVVLSNATKAYFGDNVVSSAHTGRICRFDYVCLTHDTGGNVLSSGGTVAYYGGLVNASGALSHTP